jgi:hypothetical protein
MEATPLHPKFFVLNFEIPGQFKKNNLPRTPYEIKSLVNKVFFYQNMSFLHAKIIHRCRRLPPKIC